MKKLFFLRHQHRLTRRGIQQKHKLALVQNVWPIDFNNKRFIIMLQFILNRGRLKPDAQRLLEIFTGSQNIVAKKIRKKLFWPSDSFLFLTRTTYNSDRLLLRKWDSDKFHCHCRRWMFIVIFETLCIPIKPSKHCLEEVFRLSTISLNITEDRKWL